MYPFGSEQNDTEMSTESQYEWRCKRINTFESGIRFFTRRHYKLYVSNGSHTVTNLFHLSPFMYSLVVINQSIYKLLFFI